jgi:predicted transcriptional regulator of viral defense system
MPHFDMGRHRDVERRISALAQRQHGVVTRGQLTDIGLGVGAIDHRLRNGRLITLHRGVYALGHRALRPEGHLLAAVLACGPGAVLSHASAAAWWGLRSSSAAIVDVTVPTAAGRRRRRSTLRVHRRAALPAAEVTVREGIPITTPARTLFDLASVAGRRPLERAMDEAEVRGLFDRRSFEAVAAAHPTAPGAAAFKAVLAEHTAGSTVTRSDLEELFIGFCDTYELDRPVVNGTFAEFEVDFLWPAHRLGVEVDGWRFHRTRSAFERDRMRDAVLTAHGVRVLRFTDRQVKLRPQEVLEAIVAARRERAIAASAALAFSPRDTP